MRAIDRVNDVTICSSRHVIGYKGELLRKNQGQQASTSSPLDALHELLLILFINITLWLFAKFSDMKIIQ